MLFRILLKMCNTDSSGPQPQHLVLKSVCSNTQLMYSWRWPYRCPKHVELFKIINKFVHQVGTSRQFYIWCTDTHTSKLKHTVCVHFFNRAVYEIIIIIIIWQYNPLWVLPFSARSLQVLLSLAVSFQFFIFSFFKSSMTCSCHRCLGLPTSLVPIGFQSTSFLVGLAWSILCIWPSHLILCA